MPTTPDRAYSRALLARQPLQWPLTTREESGGSTTGPLEDYDDVADGANDDNAAEGANDDNAAEGANDQTVAEGADYDDVAKGAHNRSAA